MHILLAVGVTLLTATSPDLGQVALAPAPPVNITFVKASFEDAISTIARITRTTIEIDRSVSAQLRREPLADTTLDLRGATLDETLDWVTRMKGLTYSVVNAQTVRIHAKA